MGSLGGSRFSSFRCFMEAAAPGIKRIPKMHRSDDLFAENTSLSGEAPDFSPRPFFEQEEQEARERSEVPKALFQKVMFANSDFLSKGSACTVTTLSGQSDSSNVNAPQCLQQSVISKSEAGPE